MFSGTICYNFTYKYVHLISCKRFLECTYSCRKGNRKEAVEQANNNGILVLKSLCKGEMNFKKCGGGGQAKEFDTQNCLTWCRIYTETTKIITSPLIGQFSWIRGFTKKKILPAHCRTVRPDSMPFPNPR